MPLRLLKGGAQAPAEPLGGGKDVDPLGALADAASEGDGVAVRTLVVAVSPAMLRAVRGVLGARHRDVEDIVQEAVIALVRALPSFRHESVLLHFATRIAVLTALSACRRGKVRHEKSHDTLEIDLEDDAASPADEVHAARRRELLRELCTSLPSEQGTALVMHCMLGFTVEEVADACVAPANTIRSRLRLAKEALRARIAAEPSLREALEPA